VRALRSTVAYPPAVNPPGRLRRGRAAREVGASVSGRASRRELPLVCPRARAACGPAANLGGTRGRGLDGRVGRETSGTLTGMVQRAPDFPGPLPAQRVVRSPDEPLVAKVVDGPHDDGDDEHDDEHADQGDVHELPPNQLNAWLVRPHSWWTGPCWDARCGFPWCRVQPP